ncbi:hypothetical protein EAY15_23525 [Vibrio anguillarum]|nr:hypothetical protein [Vibrio anguillarum]MBF4432662.1 hypothetical protein [Vibrio anguillarum]
MEVVLSVLILESNRGDVAKLISAPKLFRLFTLFLSYKKLFELEKLALLRLGELDIWVKS